MSSARRRHPRHAAVGGSARVGVGAVAVVVSSVGCSVPEFLGGSGCSNARDTQYIPSQSPVVFEQDGVQVSINRVWSKTLTVEVTSSDGRYDGTWVDPHGPIYEGLELQSEMGFDWTAPGELEAGQVRPVLRVYDCWTVVTGPADLW